jgi:hypothetical protein
MRALLAATAILLVPIPAVAQSFAQSPADRPLLVEPCHSIRLQYNTNIREVHVDETLLEATVPVQNQRLLILSAKPKTTHQKIEKGNETITNSFTSCDDATVSTTLIVLDENENEIFPSTPAITSNEVLVQPPGLPGRVTIHKGLRDSFTYSCTPGCTRIQ